jgi:hypothetical protein
MVECTAWELRQRLVGNMELHGLETSTMSPVLECNFPSVLNRLSAVNWPVKCEILKLERSPVNHDFKKVICCIQPRPQYHAHVIS